MPIAKKTKRNQKLYQDKISGSFSIAQLIAKYKISPGRLYQIFKNEEKKQLKGATV